MVEAGLVFVEDSKNATQHRCISVNRSEEHSPGDRSKGVLDVGLHSDCVGVLLMKEPLHVCHCSEASLGTRAELGRMEELLEGVFQDCKAQSADEATKSFTYAMGRIPPFALEVATRVFTRRMSEHSEGIAPARM